MVSLHHILRFISLNGSFLSVHPQLPKLPSLPLLSCYNRLSLRLRFAFCIACALVWVNCKDIVRCGWWVVVRGSGSSDGSSLLCSLCLFCAKGVKLLFYCILFHLARLTQPFHALARKNTKRVL